MKKLTIVLMVLFLPIGGFSQTYSSSLVASAETKRPVLLIFSGSDWCASCIRFEKTILSEAAFQSFATESLTIVKADFPQRKKISEEQKKQNEALAEQYNPKGLFPHILLLDADHSVLTTLTFSNQTPEQFISTVRSYIHTQQHSPTNE